MNPPEFSFKSNSLAYTFSAVCILDIALYIRSGEMYSHLTVYIFVVFGFTSMQSSRV